MALVPDHVLLLGRRCATQSSINAYGASLRFTREILLGTALADAMPPMTSRRQFAHGHFCDKCHMLSLPFQVSLV